MSIAPGTRLGPYEIVEPIGSGGMGEVYRATDTKLGREVAIKTLPSALAKDADRLARFEHEAKLLAALNHAHIAAIYGLDEHEGTQYLAMELVEGETLEQKLKAGPLPLEAALHLALQIAEALEAAHDKGVVHRDLKPANIMVTAGDQVKVLDFGLAKAFSGDPNAASPAHSPALSAAMTQQGLILGTAGYMSPEQASGQATDQRADIWAFGVVLYEMLTGLPLFSGESVPHILADVLRADPDWSRLPKNLHPRLKLLLERCLDKKVRDRYHSIADVRVDIEKVLSDPAGIAVPQGDAQPTGEARMRSARRTGTLIVTGLVVAILVAWSLSPAPRPRFVDRFYYDFPKGQTLRYVGRSVMALSPDGRRFVYNAVGGLYLRSMGDLEARIIPGTDKALNNPFFSPDGQSIAYWAFGAQPNSGSLERSAITGGAPVVIAHGVANPYGASWESGGTILYGQPQGIFRVSADGGKPKLVIAAKKGETLYGPELLPGGGEVLFSATATGNWDQAQIVAQSLSTDKRTVLVNGGSDAHYVARRLIYAFGDKLFGIGFNPDRVAVSGSAVPLVQGVMRAPNNYTAAANYAVSKDGTLVYVSGGLIGGGQTLVWVDREGREELTGLKPCVCGNPALSPDGTRVALSSATQDQTNSEIWIWSLAAHTFTRLTFQPGLHGAPLWTPDGKRIIYSSPKGLYWRRSDGTGTAEQLLRDPDASPGAWTADGQLIFTDMTPGNFDIDLLAVSGDRKPRPLLATKFNEMRPALSPDGRWLAYQSDESGHFEVYVRPYPKVDDGKWQISSGGGEEPHWSRDGHTLFFLGPKRVMAAAVTDSSAFAFQMPKPVLERGKYEFDSGTRQYGVSPDGKRLLLLKFATSGSAGASQPRIVVVTNWLQEFERLVP